MIHPSEDPKAQSGFVWVQTLILSIDLHAYKARHSAGFSNTWPHCHPKYNVLDICLAVQAGISAAELSPCSLIYKIISVCVPFTHGINRLPEKDLSVLRWIHFSLNI